MLKFLNGEKKLSEAFWLSVTLVLLSTIAVLVLKELEVFASFSSQLLATFLITVPVRLFAWISVFRCLKNSTNSVLLSYGPPGPGDGLRVSGMYTFISDADEVFTTYDYKSTAVWDTDSGLSTQEEFWSSSEPVELGVGGADGSDYQSFVSWITKKHARWEGMGN